MASATDLILCFDLGGTKLRAGYVNPRGRIIGHAYGKVRQDEGFPGLIELFREVSSRLPRKSYVAVSVASAGPLHAGMGVLLDPTNFFTHKQSWGVLPLVQELKKVFRKPVYLENDAVAAVFGERWKGGHGSKAKNMIAMTLGTGVGIGVIANDELVRAGRGLHPEVSHMPLNFENKDYRCGCGAYGCIEAYLGGSHFTRRIGHLKGQTLSGPAVVKLAVDGDPEVVEAFRKYGEHMAYAVRALCVAFAPEVIVLSGGFSHAAELFLKETRVHLPRLMERYRKGIDLLPEIKVSKLQNEAGILGAAYMAFQKRKKNKR